MLRSTINLSTLFTLGRSFCVVCFYVCLLHTVGSRLRGSFSSNTRLASCPHCRNAQYFDYCSDSLHNYGILCMSMQKDLPTLQHTSFGPRFWQNVTWHYNSGGSLPVIQQFLPHANVFIFGMFARTSGVPKFCVSPTHLLSFVYQAYSQSIAHCFHLYTWNSTTYDRTCWTSSETSSNSSSWV